MSDKEKVEAAGYLVDNRGRAYQRVRSTMTDQPVRLYPGLDERRAFLERFGIDLLQIQEK